MIDNNIKVKQEELSKELNNIFEIQLKDLNAKNIEKILENIEKVFPQEEQDKYETKYKRNQEAIQNKYKDHKNFFPALINKNMDLESYKNFYHRIYTFIKNIQLIVNQ